MTKRSAAADSGKTAEQQLQLQQQTQQGFQQTYSHHTKIEESTRGEPRITVSIYANDTETAKTEVLRLYNELKEALTND
jgi:hypothetical protein